MMTSSGENRSWRTSSDAGPSGHARGSWHGLPLRNSLHSALNRPDSRASDIVGRHWEFLSGEHAQNTAAEISAASATSRHPPRGGIDDSHHWNEPRGNAHAGSLPLSSQDSCGFLECPERVFHRHSAGVTHATPFSNGQPATPLPVMVPRGTSPFAAACAARLAMTFGAEERAYPHNRGEPAPSVTGSRQANRRVSPATSGDPGRLLVTQPTPSTYRQPIGQGLLAEPTVDSPFRLRLLRSSVDQRTRRNVSWSSDLPNTPELQSSLQPGSVYSSSSRGGATDEHIRGADHRHGNAQFLPTFSPVGRRHRNATRNTAENRDYGEPTSSYSEGSRRGTFCNGSGRESVAEQSHRSFATTIVRSVLSALTSHVTASFGRPWGEEQVRERGVSSPPMEHQRASQRVFGDPRTSFVVLSTSTPSRQHFRAFEHDLGGFMEEFHRVFDIDDGEGFDTPIFLLFSGGDAEEADDVLPQFPADAGGMPVPFHQVCEARNLRSSLEQHTIKWTYGSTTAGGATRENICPSAVVQAPLSDSRRVAAQEETLETPTAFNGGAFENPPRSTQHPQTQNGKDCCICLSSFESGDSLLTLRCLHIFHADCLDRWIKTSHNVKCPLCSTKIAEPPTGAVHA